MTTDMLASSLDVQDRLGRDLTATETTQVDAWLRDATSLIQSYTRRHFFIVTDDVVNFPMLDEWIRLPQSPITAITSVTVGGDPVPYQLVVDRLWLQTNRYSFGPLYGLPPYVQTLVVTYSHGYATIPQDVVGVCCALVLRLLTNPESQSSENIGNYSYSRGSGAQGVPQSVWLSKMDKLVLDRYRPRGRSLPLRLV